MFEVAGFSPRELGGRIWGRLESDAVLTHAAAMSFFMGLALFPTFFLVVAFVGLLPLAGTLDRSRNWTSSSSRTVLPSTSREL